MLRALAAAALTTACAAPEVSTTAQPIINGTPDDADPAVVAIVDATGRLICSGTLIAPHVVLTAAHCDVRARSHRVFFGSDVSKGAALEVLNLGRILQNGLPEPSATLIKLVYNRDVAALGAWLLPYVDHLGQDPALSPDRSPAPAAAVYLLHGSDDNVIPAVESELLAAHLEGKAPVRTLVSSFLTHVDLSTRPTPADTWQMIAFWKAALGEQ